MVALALAACGGESYNQTEPDDTSEYGSAEQGFTAQCLSPQAFGVDLSGAANYRCNVNVSSHNCHFPGGINGGVPFSFPFGVALSTGWTTAEKNELAAANTQAATHIDTTFWACLTVAAPQSPHFWFSPSDSTLRVQIRKAALPGGFVPKPSFTTTPFENIASFVCDASHGVSEPYNATVRGCTHWIGTVDYAKIKTWAGSQRQQVMKNLMRQFYGMAMGLGHWPGTGLPIGGPGEAMATSIHRDFDQSNWDQSTGAGDVGWVCNYLRHPYDPDPSFLTCINNPP